MAARLARARLAYPEWWVHGLAVCAWTALLLTHVFPGGARAHHAHHGHHSHHDASGPVLDDSASDAALFLVMVAAMMLPLAGRGVRHVARASFWKRRQRAAACYLVGFAIVWAAFGLALYAARVAVPLSGSDAGLLAATAAAAGLWQRSPRRMRVARRCGNRPALPQRGWRATSCCLRAGGVFGFRCIPLCGAAMAIMAVTPHLVLMAATFGIQAYEWRPGPNPFAVRRWRAPAVAYGAIATMAAVVAVA